MLLILNLGLGVAATCRADRNGPDLNAAIMEGRLSGSEFFNKYCPQKRAGPVSRPHRLLSVPSRSYYRGPDPGNSR